MIIRHRGNPQNALAGLSGAGDRALFDGLEDYARSEMHGFGAWDPSTSALIVIAKVRLAYAAGGQLVKLFPMEALDVIAKQLPLTAFYTPELLTSPSQGALAKAYRDLGERIDTWADRNFRWAKQGKRDDGTPYSWERWGELGNTYLDSITYYTRLSVSDNYFLNATQAVKEFVESVRVLFTPTEWPTWAKVAAGLAGVAAVAYIVRSAADSVRAVRGS